MCPELLISDKRYLKEFTTLILLPISIIGVGVVVCLIPAALIMDFLRLVKLRRYQYISLKRRMTYVRCVLRSLDRKPDRYNMKLLMVA